MANRAGVTGEIAPPSRGPRGPSAAPSREAEPAGSIRAHGGFAPTSPQHTSGGSQQHIPHTTESGLVERHVNTGLRATVTTNSIGAYYRARYYDPLRSRFVSEDPIGFGGGDLNFYTYVADAPINRGDPSGLWTLSIGLSVNGTWFGGTGGGFAGVAIDDSGRLGTYWGWGAGAGVGGGFSGGLDAYYSDAKTVCDLAGPFVNGTLGGGWGPNAAGGVFMGGSPHGNVHGGGVSIGAGLGASSSVMLTQTSVTPLTGKCGCQ